jgi:hypothetical protein
MAQTAALSAKEAEEAQQASSSVVRPAGLENAGASITHSESCECLESTDGLCSCGAPYRSCTVLRLADAFFPSDT